MRVTVYCEQLDDAAVARVYPEGMGEAIAAAVRDGGEAQVETATLGELGDGSGGVLSGTDVLLWWGHRRHDEVPDALAAQVQARVLDGMGLVVLHSGHLSKPFRLLMGTSCNLRWR